MDNLLNAEKLLEGLSYLGLFAVVFSESGLLLGFFLPGDSLLFSAGLFSARPLAGTQFNIFAVCAVCAAGAIIGDQVGYVFGKRVGPAIFRRPNSRIFKQAYVEKSQEFFDAHGAKTIVLARFVPIVRTFAPVLAGVSKMKYSTFVRYNVVGGLVWGVGVPVIGYFLGQVDFIAKNIEVMLLIIVAISVLPVAFELLRHRLFAGKRDAATSGLPADDPDTATATASETSLD